MNTDKKNPTILCELQHVVLKDGCNSYSCRIEKNSIHAFFSEDPQVSISLLRCIAGLEKPMSGNLYFDGNCYKEMLPKQAVDSGIEIVDHSQKCFLNLSVLDNIYCERRQIGHTHAYSRAATKQRLKVILNEIGIELDLKRRVRSLSPAYRKLVELMRCILASPKVLCLEEGVLRDIEEHTYHGIREILMTILLRMVANNLTLIIATNNMHEVSSYAKKVTIFKKDGDTTSVSVRDIDKYELIQMAYGFITSRKEMAQDNFELYYYKQMYQEIVNSLLFPVIATDTHHLVIIYNQKVKNDYFSEFSDILGKHIKDILGLTDEFINEMERDLLYLPNTRAQEIPEVFPGVTIHASPITDEMGSFMGMLYLFSTDYGVAGTQMSKSTDIECDYKINELIHEVKNPLGIMLNYLSLIQKETSLQTIKQETDCIAKEVSRINRLLDKLKMSQDTTVQKKLKKVKLRSVLDEIQTFLRPTIEEKVIKFQNDLPTNLSVGGDEDSLRQVFLNLIINSIEAMESGGVVRISSETIILKDELWVKIMVSDTGSGIPSDQISHIFKPFYTTKTNRDSHGIGLSITNEIIESLGGSINVDSKVGVGTNFTILLRP